MGCYIEALEGDNCCPMCRAEFVIEPSAVPVKELTALMYMTHLLAEQTDSQSPRRRPEDHQPLHELSTYLLESDARYIVQIRI
jgi:hypothetical protein